MAMEITPRSSRSSSSASSRNKPSLTLDLSNLPPLSLPTPPSNTILLTNLTHQGIFRPDTLATIRAAIERQAPIYAFAPLKSFSRILVTFYDIEAAIIVRRSWDGRAIQGERCKVYFTQNTPIRSKDEHLALPDAGKLFFISPPPSPPHGWESRLEDAPNKLVHADDLAAALAKLNHSGNNSLGVDSPMSPVEFMTTTSSGRGSRSRGSTLIYQPDENSPHMPAVVVEDMTEEPEEMSPMDYTRPIKAHTARPPVELMLDA